MSAIAAMIFLPRGLGPHLGGSSPHPDPRPGITAELVLADDKLPNKKSIRRAYQHARDYPAIFDGIHCPCDCRDSMHHRSLLSCFETDQPVGCGACRESAALIGPLAKDGKSLATFAPP